jgi:HoxN/HupN/NixA family high-affinity nickel-transporter
LDKCVELIFEGRRRDGYGGGETEHERRVAEREEEPDTDRPLSLLHQLARHIVDGGDMIGIHRMAQPEPVGQKRNAQQQRVIMEDSQRGTPKQKIGQPKKDINADHPAARSALNPCRNAASMFNLPILRSVSAFFLLAIAVMNALIFFSLIAAFRRVKNGETYSNEDLNILLAKRGFFARLFRSLFKLIDHSWQMYPVGFLFGLGFDTATEVGLLGISAAAASKGLPIWSIMVFPALFTAGMALIDTTDSILMLGAYGWAFMKPVRKLFYNIGITAVSVVVAVAVGGLETLGLIQNTYQLTGSFWEKVALLNGDSAFGLLGYGIIGILVLAWIVSVTVYKLKRYDEIEVILTD